MSDVVIQVHVCQWLCRLADHACQLDRPFTRVDDARELPPALLDHVGGRISDSSHGDSAEHVPEAIV